MVRGVVDSDASQSQPQIFVDNFILVNLVSRSTLFVFSDFSLPRPSCFSLRSPSPSLPPPSPPSSPLRRLSFKTLHCNLLSEFSLFFLHFSFSSPAVYVIYYPRREGQTYTHTVCARKREQGLTRAVLTTCLRLSTT